MTRQEFDNIVAELKFCCDMCACDMEVCIQDIEEGNSEMSITPKCRGCDMSYWRRLHPEWIQRAQRRHVLIWMLYQYPSLLNHWTVTNRSQV